VKEIQNARKPSYYQFEWLDCIDPSRAVLTEEQYVFVKRIVDLVLTVAAMPLWLSVIGVCAFLIKLESPRDPVFFRQMRTGKGGRRFPMFKFRTMVVNAERLEAELAHLSKLKWPDFKIENDPRVTKVGRLLRRTSLDEFPQFFNVLRGEMSLVGPRPEVQKFVYLYTEDEKIILSVRPGITDWSSIRFHNEGEIIAASGIADADEAYAKLIRPEKLRLQMKYVRERTLLIDIKILICTIITVFSTRLGGKINPCSSVVNNIRI